MELIDSLLRKLAGALVVIQGALRDVGVAREILRQRRREHGERPHVDLTDLVDESQFIVRWKGAKCHFGPTVPFRLFCCLARRANRYVPNAILSEKVWKQEGIGGTTVRSTVRRLRNKLKDSGMGELAGAIQVDGNHYGLMLRSLTQ